MIALRLTCSAFWVDVGSWRSTGAGSPADTPDGPSLGLGERAIDAIEGALEPFEGMVDELLATVPDDALGG